MYLYIFYITSFFSISLYRTYSVGHGIQLSFIKHSKMKALGSETTDFTLFHSPCISLNTSLTDYRKTSLVLSVREAHAIQCNGITLNFTVKFNSFLFFSFWFSRHTQQCSGLLLALCLWVIPDGA